MKKIELANQWGIFRSASGRVKKKGDDLSISLSCITCSYSNLIGQQAIAELPKPLFQSEA